MWNRSIRLIHQKGGKTDKDGFEKKEHVCSGKIPAGFQDVTRNDQILAEQSGYEVDQNIEIMACNYNREPLLMDEETGEIYEIMRTFRLNRSRKIILTCRCRERGTVKEGKNGTV